MRKNVYEYLQSKPKLIQFLREKPIWYRKLTRNPDDLEQFELASMHHFKQTIPHKVEKFTTSVEMANMMLHMYQAMKNQG
jgi:hypothetical protein